MNKGSGRTTKRLARTEANVHVPLPSTQQTVRGGEGVVVESDSQREADRILLQKYAPASVLVDADWEILQFRGSTAPYLESPPGGATRNLLKVAREGLLAPLRTALHQAKKDDRPVRVEGLRVKFDGRASDFNLEVIPVKSMAANDRSFLAIFESAPPAVELKPALAKATEPDSGRGAKRRSAAQRQTAELQSELNAAREYLQSVIEQQEAYNEELQSANEEIQFKNEELQRINQELETAREELQSSNEKLTTINEELHNLNQEVNQVNNDLGNLLSSVQMPIIMLGKDLRIRRFTPMTERSLNLVANDIGRPITDLNLNLNLPTLPELLMEAIDSVSARELEVQDRQGRCYSLRIQPYKTSENGIDGAVMVLIDIERLKQADEKLRQQNRLIESSYEPIFIWDFDTGIVEWNHGCEELYGFTRAEAVGSNNHELLRTIHPLSIEEFEARLEAHGEWTGELRHTTKDGRDVIVESRQQLSKTDGRWLVLETNRDITARKQAEEAMRESEERLRLAQQAAQVHI